jgi:hypothetical protein
MGVGYRLLRRPGVGDVEGDGVDALAVVGDEIVELGGLAGGGGDAVAGVESGLGSGHGRGHARSR